MERFAVSHHIILSTVFIAACFVVMIPLALTRSLDESLLIIRGGFEDGLYDLAATEAQSFVSHGKNHEALGEVFLILGYVHRNRSDFRNAREYFLKATVSALPELRVQGFYEAASIAWTQKEFSNAADYFMSAINQGFSSTLTEQSQYWAVMSLYRAGRFSELTLTASRVLENESDLTSEQLIQILYCRGKAGFYLNLFADSVSDLESVYHSGLPDVSQDSAMTLALIHIELENMVMADFWALKRLESGYSQKAHSIRASYSLEQGNIVCARKHLLAIAEHDDTNVNDRMTLLLKAARCEADILLSAKRAWWKPLLDYGMTYPDSPHLNSIATLLPRYNDLSSMPLEIIEFTAYALPWSPDVSGPYLAQLFLSVEEYDQALFWLVSSYIANPDKVPDPSDRLFLARLLAASGDHDNAARELLDLDFSSEDETADIAAVFQQADFFNNAGMFTRAASLYQQILVTADVDADSRQRAMFNLANTWFQLEEWSLAGNVYRRFAEGHSSSGDIFLEPALRRLALSLFYSGNWQDSLDASTNYLTHFPETDYRGEVYYVKGLSEANLGKLESALYSLGLALDLLADTDLVDLVKDAVKRLNEYQTEHGGNQQ